MRLRSIAFMLLSTLFYLHLAQARTVMIQDHFSQYSAGNMPDQGIAPNASPNPSWRSNQTGGLTPNSYDGITRLQMPLKGGWHQYIDIGTGGVGSGNTVAFICRFVMPDSSQLAAITTEAMGFCADGAWTSNQTRLVKLNSNGNKLYFSKDAWGTATDLELGRNYIPNTEQSIAIVQYGDLGKIRIYYSTDKGWDDITPTNDPNGLLNVSYSAADKIGINCVGGSALTNATLKIDYVACIMDPTEFAPVNGPIVYNVRDYGALGDSTTDDTAAFQEAIDLCRMSGGTVYIPQGIYSISSLNLTNIVNGLTIKGDGINISRIMPRTNNVHVMDFTGSAFVNLERFQIGAYSQSIVPKTAIFLAAVNSGVSNAFHFSGLFITGKYTNGSLYCYGVPSSDMIDCDWYNYQDATNVPTVCFTNRNIDGLTSSYTTIGTGNWNCSDWTLTACEIHEQAKTTGASTAVGMNMDGTKEMRMIGGNISGSGAKMVRFTNTENRDIVFMGTTFYSENGTPATAAFYNENATVNSLTVEGCQIQVASEIFDGQSTHNYNEVCFNGRPSLVSPSCYIFNSTGAVVTDSRIHCDARPLTVSSIRYSVLIHPGTITGTQQFNLKTN